MAHFKVVHIHETGDVEPVPHSWEEDGTLYWPPNSHLVRKFQSDAESKPDKIIWKKYVCTVKETNILLFMHASSSCQNYIDSTSASSEGVASDSDEDSNRFYSKKQTTKNSSVLSAKSRVLQTKYAALEKPAYDFCASIPKVNAPASKVPTTALKKITSKATAILKTSLPTAVEEAKASVSSSRGSTSLKKTNQICTPKTSKSSSVLVKENEVQKDNDTTLRFDYEEQNVMKRINDLFDALNTWQEDVCKAVRDVAIRLERIEQLVQKIEYPVALPEGDGELQIMFPISERKDLHKFEKDMKDAALKRKVFSHFNRVVGAAMPWKIACYKLCNNIFTKELLTHFSWTGMSRNNNKDAFKNLHNILDIFYRVVYKADNTFSYPQRDSFFRDGILKHSHTRLNQSKRGKKEIVQLKETDENQILEEEQVEEWEEINENTSYATNYAIEDGEVDFVLEDCSTMTYIDY